MMDAATTFLHRHERRAIMRRRKGEPLRAVVPVMNARQAGLLAITPTRVLHAQRGRLRTPVRQWRRRDVAGIRFENVRYGMLLLALRSGEQLRFEFVSRDDARSVEQAMVPPRRQATAPSVAFQAGRTTGGPVLTNVRRPDAPDPLAHRGTHEHQARLRKLHAKGVLTKAELEWQLAA